MKLLEAVRRGLRAILDAILPLRARAARTSGRSLADIPLQPDVHDLLGVHITTLMDYRREEVEDLIQSLKYDASNHAVQLAAGILFEYLREEIADIRAFSQKPIYILAVPLHAARSRERGYNQIGLVVQALPSELRDGTLAQVRSDLLERTRATKPQTRLLRSERLSNVAGAFSFTGRSNLKKAHVFLIDDVATTGATLANAATPLRRAGAQVHLLALARA